MTLKLYWKFGGSVGAGNDCKTALGTPADELATAATFLTKTAMNANAFNEEYVMSMI